MELVFFYIFIVVATLVLFMIPIYLFLEILSTLQEKRKKTALLKRLDEMTAKLDKMITEEASEENISIDLLTKEDLEDDGK